MTQNALPMRTVMIALLALYACSQPAAPPAAEQSAAPAPLAVTETPQTDAWIGKWIGVEGNTLTIDATGVKGLYAIVEGTLDGEKRYAGNAEGDHIAFVDAGTPGVLKASDGDATGLKYLAGKKNCLTIESGRGFCRD
jgi:hypothetical protein